MADRMRLLWIGAGLLLLVFVPAYLLTLTPGHGIPRDGTSLVVGRDFLNIWMYGRAAWAENPAQYYDIQRYLSALGPVVGSGYPGQLWSYPPAALLGLMSGQFALMAAAVVLTVLRWRESRPICAGLLLGLLLVKPQIALFFPLLFLVTGNIRAFVAAACSSLGLAALVALFWGVGIWRIYLESGIANQSLVLSDPDHLAGPFMPTLFMNLRVAGVPFRWPAPFRRRSPSSPHSSSGAIFVGGPMLPIRLPISSSSPAPYPPPPICCPMTRSLLRRWRFFSGRGAGRPALHRHLFFFR